jgi:HSP20 family protein
MAQERQGANQPAKEAAQQKQPPQPQKGEKEQKGLQRASGGETRLARPGEWGSPFTMMRRFMDQMDELFSDFGFGSFGRLGALERLDTWMPAMETQERDGRIVLRVELPDVDAADVKVEVLDDQLVISAERKQQDRYSSFERRLTLPEECDPNSVEASFEKGVLEVSLKTPQKQQGRKIDIKTQGSQGPGSVH